MRSFSRGQYEDLLNLDVPENEQYALLAGLLTSIRDEYAFNSEHGLDGYLSVRIRHGTLAAHLRRPLENLALVTRRDRHTGQYAPNSYWSTKIGGGPRAVQSMVVQRLARFSREYDEHIQGILTKWVHVSCSASQPGAIELHLAPPLVSLLASQIAGGAEFRDIIEDIFLGLDACVDVSLEELRGRITGEATASALELLRTLEADLEGVAATSGVGDLVNSIRAARTAVQQAYARVAEWFTRSREEAFEPFSPQEAVGISAEATRAVSQHFTVRESIDEDVPDLQGVPLTTFVDIFSMAFDNIVRHADLGARASAHVIVALNDGELRVAVENALGAGVDVVKLEVQLAILRDRIVKGEHLTAVRREGGTGLLKIAKVLQHDMPSAKEYWFGVVERRVFRLAFVVPINGVERRRALADEHSGC